MDDLFLETNTHDFQEGENKEIDRCKKRAQKRDLPLKS
ncbi:hypothetical protein RV04_GL002284 [Enterococcus hermanniensis]|uniref:Uncharacterized protein n=1 Tax=Enterococcus hermanniensis TaxID=249189 RepID=A0A1L8TLR6_9ENTE|nr:hypothetical protein RV04_GL002284 [Enterococcus hermanniensis]